MAKLLSYGTVPVWGIKYRESNAYLLNTLSFNGAVQEYESKGNYGNIIGYLAYDQRADFTMNAAVNAAVELDELPKAATLITLNNFEVSGLQFNPDLGNGKTATSIVKTPSSTMTAGDAMTIDIQGTVYNFGLDDTDGWGGETPPDSTQGS